MTLVVYLLLICVMTVKMGPAAASYKMIYNDDSSSLDHKMCVWRHLSSTEGEVVDAVCSCYIDSYSMKMYDTLVVWKSDSDYLSATCYDILEFVFPVNVDTSIMACRCTESSMNISQTICVNHTHQFHHAQNLKQPVEVKIQFH